MSKLSFDALKERAEAVASEDLLNSISGGTENSCHTLPEGDGTGAVSFEELFRKWDALLGITR